MSKRKTQIDREIEELDAEIHWRQRMRERLVEMRAKPKGREGDRPLTPTSRLIGK